MEESKASLERGIDECERHAKTRERVRECMGISFWRKGFQSKSCGTGGQISCQIHQEQIQEQRNLGHGRSEATVRVGIFDPAGPRLGDRHETGCERGQENGTDVLENPVLVLVPGCREQIHDAFDVIKLERMQEVMFVARDPKKPEEPEERGRSTPVTAIQMEKGTIVCKTTEADVANVAVDDSMEITISLLGATAEKNVRTEKTLRGFGRNDHVTKRECLNSLRDMRRKCRTQMLDHWTTDAVLANSSKSLFV